MSDLHSPQTIHLSGPMSGIPDYNYPLFNKTADTLRALGHTVFNPAELPKTWSWRKLMGRNLNMICEEATAQVLLPGWNESDGARIEKALAQRIGISQYEVQSVDPLRFVELDSDVAYRYFLDNVDSLGRADLTAYWEAGFFYRAYKDFGDSEYRRQMESR